MGLSDTVRSLMEARKGILFAGESNEVERERLAAFGVSTPEAIEAYLTLLATTPGIEENLSGVILSPDSLRENADGKSPILKLFTEKNISVGVSLDLARTSEENFFESLRVYRSSGVTFALLAVTFPVSKDPISEEVIKNLSMMGEVANACQKENVVPIIGVDVPMYGSHSAVQAEDHILEALSLLMDSLKTHSTALPETIVATSMAVSASDVSARADQEEAAARTVRAVTTAVPDAIGGVLFLSDSQNPEEGTANLNALARLEPLPWPIAFCFARALAEPVLAAWKGNSESFAEAQAVFKERLLLLSRADAGAYSKTLENP